LTKIQNKKNLSLLSETVKIKIIILAEISKVSYTKKPKPKLDLSKQIINSSGIKFINFSELFNYATSTKNSTSKNKVIFGHKNQMTMGNLNSNILGNSYSNILVTELNKSYDAFNTVSVEKNSTINKLDYSTLNPDDRKQLIKKKSKEINYNIFIKLNPYYIIHH
jgi:hypothetical protein